MPVAVPLAIAGATVAGAAITSHATNKAAKIERQAAQQNNALQADIYGQNKAALSPFVMGGGAATPTINAALGLGGDPAASAAAFDSFRNSNGYQFRFDQGQKAVTAALGGRGYLDSGAAQKSLLRYGQGTASDEFSRWLGALQGQQGMGLTAASAQAGVGQNYANAVSQNNNMAANSSANAALAGAGAINGALSNALSAYSLYSGMGSSYGSPNASALGSGTGIMASRLYGGY